MTGASPISSPNPEALNQIYTAIHALSSSPDRAEDNLERIEILSKQINALNSDEVPKELREGIAQIQQQDPKNTFEIARRIFELQKDIPKPLSSQQAQIELMEKVEKEHADIRPQEVRAVNVAKQEILQRLNEQQCTVCAKEINDLLTKVDALPNFLYDYEELHGQIREIEGIINTLEKNGLKLPELKDLLNICLAKKVVVQGFVGRGDSENHSKHYSKLDEAIRVFREKTREVFEDRSEFPDQFQDGIAKFLESTARELAKMPRTPDKNVKDIIVKLQVMIDKHLENPASAPFREILIKLRDSLPKFLPVQQEAQQQRANKGNRVLEVLKEALITLRDSLPNFLSIQQEAQKVYSKALAEASTLLKTEISNFSKVYRPLNSSLKDFHHAYLKWANNAKDKPSLQELEMLLRQERVDFSIFNNLLDYLCYADIKNLKEVVPFAKMLIEKFHQDASHIHFISFEALFYLDEPPLSLESLIPGTLTFKEDVRSRPAAQLVELFIKNGFCSEPNLTYNQEGKLTDHLLLILLTQKFDLLSGLYLKKDIVFTTAIVNSNLPLEDLVYMGVDFPFPDFSSFASREGWMKEIAYNFFNEFRDWHQEQAMVWDEKRIIEPKSTKGKETFVDLMNRHMLPKLRQYFTFLENRKTAENQLHDELVLKLIEVTGMAKDVARLIASYEEEPNRAEVYKRCKAISVKAQRQKPAQP